MNFLQQFLTGANAQTRGILQEAFSFVGDTVVYYGTFGDPQILPVMTRQGYQDHLVTPLKAEASQWTVPPAQHAKLVRSLTGQTFFVQAVANKEVVVYTFILTEKQLS